MNNIIFADLFELPHLGSFIVIIINVDIVTDFNGRAVCIQNFGITARRSDFVAVFCLGDNHPHTGFACFFPGHNILPVDIQTLCNGHIVSACNILHVVCALGNVGIFDGVFLYIITPDIIAVRQFVPDVVITVVNQFRGNQNRTGAVFIDLLALAVRPGVVNGIAVYDLQILFDRSVINTVLVKCTALGADEVLVNAVVQRSADGI